eukprot:TRINITY_DN16198_c0_g1_i1.p2 TRINITY_DN16198_c0_g1~~TRINITY_DN16198_c0_g1_i1.p2  ORF type:complete len:105 (+),score=2.72 TRINITY_DN16198_c0_g1_i1:263-577(+)
MCASECTSAIRFACRKVESLNEPCCRHHLVSVLSVARQPVDLLAWRVWRLECTTETMINHAGLNSRGWASHWEFPLSESRNKIKGERSLLKGIRGMQHAVCGLE